MSKKNKNKAKSPKKRNGFFAKLDSSDRMILIIFLIAYLFALAMIIVPQYVRKHIVDTWGVIRQITEPVYHSRYDSEKKKYDRYYTTTLTVEYEDPDTGEKASAKVLCSRNKKEWLPGVGEEFKISLLQLGNRQIRMAAQPNWFFHFISIVGVCGMIALTVYLVQYFRGY